MSEEAIDIETMETAAEETPVETPAEPEPAKPYHFTANRKDFLRELNVAVRTIERKTTIPILTNVKLSAFGDWLVLVATDLEVGYTTLCRATVYQEGETTLPGYALKQIVSDASSESIEIRSHEETLDCAVITAGTSTMRLAGISVESFPVLPTISAEYPALAVIEPAALLTMIGRTKFAISKDDSRFNLKGVLIEIGGGEIRMVATDGHRLAFASSKLAGAPEERKRFLLPARGLAEMEFLCKQRDAGPVTVKLDENHAFLQQGTRMLVCRRLTGTFPDYERVLPTEYSSITVAGADSLHDLVGRANRFADQRSHAIRMNLGAKVQVSASGVEHGEFSDSVPAQHVGPAMEIGFSAAYLLDFLAAAKGKPVAALGQDGTKAMEFRIAADDSYRCVVMPMRM